MDQARTIEKTCGGCPTTSSSGGLQRGPKISKLFFCFKGSKNLKNHKNVVYCGDMLRMSILEGRFAIVVISTKTITLIEW